MTDAIFNIHDVGLLLTLGQSLLLALMLLSKPQQLQGGAYLAGCIVGQGLIALWYLALYNIQISQHLPSIALTLNESPAACIELIQAYCLLCYTRHMVGQSPCQSQRELFVLLSLIALLLSPPLIGILVFKSALLAVQMGLHIFVLAVSLYLAKQAIGLIKGYHSKLKGQYAETNIPWWLQWLNIAVYGFIAIWLYKMILLVLYFLGEHQRMQEAGIYNIYLGLVVISWLVSQSLQFTPIRLEQTDEKPENHAVPAEHIAALEDIMQRAKVYQDPKLSLDDLADSLKLPKRAVSNVINQHFNSNFYDYINQYRLNDVTQQLVSTDSPQRTIAEMYELAGFNSKSTFNTLFKRVHGCTPSRYRANASHATTVND